MAWSTNQKARHKAAYHSLWLTMKAGWTRSIERPNRGFSKLSLDSHLQHEFLLEFPAWHLCNLQPLQFLHACSLNEISFSLLSNVDIIWQKYIYMKMKQAMLPQPEVNVPIHLDVLHFPAFCALSLVMWQGLTTGPCGTLMHQNCTCVGTAQSVCALAEWRSRPREGLWEETTK